VGKAVKPISHQWQGDQLTVVYEHGVTFVVDHIRPDHDGRLWVHLIAKVGDDVTNEARLDLMDDRRRVDFAAGAHGRDGQVDWQAHLVPLIRLAQQLPEPPVQEKAATSALPGSPIALAPAAPFPTEVLPAPLAQLVREGANAFPCPEDFIAVPMFSVLGTAIGASRIVEVKPGWREGARINVAVVVDPGDKKSPALDLVMRPLYRRQESLLEAYKLAELDYKSALDHYEMAMMGWKKASYKRDGTPPEKPTPPGDEPRMAQIWTSDATLEALGELLERNPRGLCFVRDELTGWVRAMNQYRGGKGADRQAWLSFWSGAPAIINRKSSKHPVVLSNPYVCVVGCLPPEVLGDLSDERGREDGFVHRILFAYPAVPPITWSDAIVSGAAIQGYAAVIQSLLDLKDYEGVGPRTVTFTPSGHAAYVELMGEVYATKAHPDCPASLRGPLAKMEGYAARLALILQLSRLAAGETAKEVIEEVSVFGAGALVHYFVSHAVKVYAQLRWTPEDKQVELALAWIRARGGTVTAREVLAGKVAGVKTASGAKDLLRRLEDHGHGTVSEGDRHRVSFTLR
jgi:hypothetical protein